jgi:hypothetical protein
MIFRTLIVFVSDILAFFFWLQDKNRDVIVAFPDVEPFVIQTPGLYTSSSKRIRQSYLRITLQWMHPMMNMNIHIYGMTPMLLYVP